MKARYGYFLGLPCSALNNIRNVCYSGMGARQHYIIIIHVFSCCQSFDQTCHVLVPNTIGQADRMENKHAMKREIKQMASLNVIVLIGTQRVVKKQAGS